MSLKNKNDILDQITRKWLPEVKCCLKWGHRRWLREILSIKSVDTGLQFPNNFPKMPQISRYWKRTYLSYRWNLPKWNALLRIKMDWRKIRFHRMGNSMWSRLANQSAALRNGHCTLVKALTGRHAAPIHSGKQLCPFRSNKAFKAILIKWMTKD